MAYKKFIYPLKLWNLPRSAGSKALNLHRLMKIEVHIPVTFVCDWQAYHRYLVDDSNLIAILKDELGRIVEPDKTYTNGKNPPHHGAGDFLFMVMVALQLPLC
jgi:phosphoenolpyruvate synthase/pyruvate phosphate dikinase